MPDVSPSSLFPSSASCSTTFFSEVGVIVEVSVIVSVIVSVSVAVVVLVLAGIVIVSVSVMAIGTSGTDGVTSTSGISAGVEGISIRIGA